MQNVTKKQQNDVKRNKFLFEKKHSRTSSEIQSKEVNEKLTAAVSEQQINWTMPAKRQSKVQNWNNKKNKNSWRFYPEGPIWSILI